MIRRPWLRPVGVKLSWTFPAELYDSLDLRPFGVTREVINEHGEKELLPIGHALIKRVGDELECTIYDSRADRDAPHTYQVTTRSFVARDRKTTSSEYEPERARQEATKELPLAPPSIVETKQLQNGDLAISWDFDMAHEEYILGFELHRREKARDAFVPVRTGLSPTTRHTLDTTQKTISNTYNYKVVALRKPDKARYNSQIVPVVISDMREPPPPQALKASVEVVDGKRTVILSWAPPTPEDTVTHRWLIDSDESNPGQVLRQSGIEPLSEPRYRYPIETLEARPYTFRVTAISQASIESMPSEITVDTPGKYLPNVVFERFELIDSAKRLRLHWRFPEGEDLLGFALYIEGQEQPDLLGPTLRQWESGELERGSNQRYNVQAVSKGGLRSYLGRDWSYRMPAGSGLPAKPKKLGVTHEVAKERIRFYWARVPDGLTHRYAVRVKPPGEAWREAGEVKASAAPVWIQRDAGTPGVWTFEVRGTTTHGLKGPAATTTHEVLPPAAPARQPEAPAVAQEHDPQGAPWLPWALGVLLV